MKIFRIFAVSAACAAAACVFAFAGGGDGGGDEVKLESLSLDTSAVKVEYVLGEAFSAQGLKVSAVYSDDTSKEVADYTITPPDMSSIGEKQVEVSYTESETTVTANYKITISESVLPPEEQSALRLDLTEVQREFQPGEAFTAAGLKVFLREGEEETELSAGEGGYELTAPVFDGAGAYTVTVAYGEHSLQYTVAVIPDVGEDMTIEFVSRDESASLTLYITERMPDKSTNTTDSTAKGIYIYKDASGYQSFNFDFAYVASGWASQFNTVGVYETPFNDFWSEDNSALFVELGDETKGVEAMRFKASGNEWHTKVLGWTEVASIDKVTIPEDKVFSANLPFDGTGIIIDYTLTDGQKGQITATEANINDGTIQFFDCETRESMRADDYDLVVGELEMRVMYDSKVFDITIEVTEGTAYLEISGGTRTFTEGDTPSAAGLVVTLIDENGVAKQLPEGEGGYTVTLPTAEQMKTPGTYKVTVTYGELIVTYDVTVTHNFTSSRDEDGTFHRTCSSCGYSEEVEVYGDRKVSINGTDFFPATGYDAANAAYGVTYDVSKGEMNAEFVITLTAENTGEGGVYAEGLNIATANNNVIVNFEEGAAKINVNVTPNGANTVTLNIAQNVAVGTVNFGDGSNGVNAIVAVINVGANSSVDAISMAIHKGVNLYLADGAYVGSYTTVDDHHEIIEVSGNATIGTLTVNGSNGSTTVQGSGTLTVNGNVVSYKGAFNINAVTIINGTVTSTSSTTILADTTVNGQLLVNDLTVGNAENTVQPELKVNVNGDMEGIKSAGQTAATMTLKFLSGNVTVTNEVNANLAVSMNASGDSIYVGENATFRSVNFMQAYGAWNSAAGTYRVEVYGSLVAEGDTQSPAGYVASNDPEEATGTYVAEGATHIVFGHMIRPSSEDVTE